ncbi:hypothetical protein KQ302_00965 [Synechococcus sp. CS-602]|uniref:hypothetical protein n=1 Tax=Synechococcaceae TaxID=1890426 RepID=UPI0008FF5C99|nr:MULTISPECIES: hypothetical protein [Synechococcaceae]MCT4363660.1 hypothetical protein [Candidatus Regnicoccus frigidus MAG-AL1]APD47324.1 hypothetical protein BM449_02155 [Synechococcus sp. SynAce01]MCT0202778.1 hypothetical protein [Synechococcus sp. CS-603]MCT0203691.1 hypothetical protein [Synechococcus sp. CS-602]MCT0245312.1 hypothetical protein [Synechococcus sp. CS-601]
MTRSRSYNRSQRWTAKLRRRSLRAALPEHHEGEALLLQPPDQLRRLAVSREQDHELLDLLEGAV